MAGHSSVEKAIADVIKKLSETTSHDRDYDEDEGIDRISELPEHIIHHIMEFLPRYDGDTTRMSVLSKKFFSCWCAFPAIDFNFVPKEAALPNKPTKSVLKYVGYCLQHRRLNNNTPLKRLTFVAPLHGGLEPEPDGNTSVVDLINFAVQNQVKELDLSATYNNNIPRKLQLDHRRNQFIKLSCFPEPVFSAKSIKILRLHGFNLSTSSDHQHVTFNLPLIEVLNLRNCSGITSIMLVGAKQLKEVDLDFCYRLDKIHIDGPTTLEVVSYGGEYFCEIDVASSCKRVKFLRLRGLASVDDKWARSNFSGIVEELSLAFCSLLMKTRWYLESLKVLKLVGCDCEVEFETPNLECFNYHSGSLRWDFPLVISSNRFEAKLDCFYDGLSSSFGVNVRFSKFISCFTDCQILTLACHSTKELIFSRDIREAILHGIKHLKIELAELHDMVELIDNLLWFAPHPNTISIINVHDPQAVKTIKVSSKTSLGFCDMVSHPSVERAMAIITKKLSEKTSHDDDDDEGIDRMSELPENIIHHIMEFLPRYDGDTTRISVLSKKFFSFWCSSPAIDFNFDFMPTETAKTKTTEYVSKYVRYCLRHRRLNNNTPLKRLTFIAPLHGGLDPDPDGNNSVVDLVNFAIENQVKELNLYATHNNIPRKILGNLDLHRRNQFINLSCFPEPVFSAKSITILRMHGFSLNTSSDHQHVTFDFPLIEVLNLRNCSGIASIMLRGAKQLKEVDLDFCYGLDKIHIDGPTTLKVLSYGGKHYCEIDIASSCKRVKILRLRGTEITDDKWVKSNFSGFVEELKFTSCSLPVKTRWYLESLKVLELVHSDCKVEFETPNLERFNYHSGTLRWDIPFVISSNRFEAKLGCFYHGLSSAYNTKPYDHVIEGFSKSIRCYFTDCQILTLVCHSTEELVFSRATRATLHPPLHGVKHLKVELSKLHDMVELIESLLWFASHPNTISIINVLDPHAVKTIKFNYNEYVCCGYMCHGKCYWQHYLKGVALEKFEDMEERYSLLSYFSTTYKISQVGEHEHA